MWQGEKLEEESASGDVRMAPKAGAYVAPGMRGGAGEKMGDSMRRPRDENSVRVTNLSEDTREHDLNELFRQFGQISRTFIAYDRETGESRGFAFINFINRCVARVSLNCFPLPFFNTLFFIPGGQESSLGPNHVSPDSKFLSCVGELLCRGAATSLDRKSVV